MGQPPKITPQKATNTTTTNNNNNDNDDDDDDNDNDDDDDNNNNNTAIFRNLHFTLDFVAITNKLLELHILKNVWDRLW